MKILKVLLITAVAACTFAEASAQIKLPPPPPAPPNPLHFKKPTVPVVRSRKKVVKRRAAVNVTLPPRPVAPPLLPR
jgi:hypothetical protein